MPKAYTCPAGVLTIGYGHTKNVQPGQVITEEEAEALLRADCADAEAAVARLVKVPLNQSQFDALVSFTFNVGAGNLERSTLLRRLNAGNYERAADEMLRWDRGGGRVLKGLTLRRDAERALFLSH